MSYSTSMLYELHTKLLSKKMATEYAISCKNYPEELSYVDIVFDAYNKANNLFDPNCKDSIVTVTLSMYLDNVENTMESFLNNATPLEAVLKLFKAIIKIQKLINSGEDTLKEQFSLELLVNKEYYDMFDLDYYFEIARIKGIDTCLAEMEEDVNIRANTFFNAAYAKYSEILPGFDEFIISLSANND